MIGDQIQVLPMFSHKATTSLLAQGKKEIKSNMFWKKSDSDSRIVKNYDGCRNLIWTLFGAYKYLLERLSRLLYNGSSLTSISVRIRL
jgi:hypothetical protein